MLSDERIAELAKSCWYEVDPTTHQKGNPAADTDDLRIESAIRTAVREAAEEMADMCKEWREDWAKRHPGPKSGTDGAFDAAYCTALDHAETAIRARIEVPRIPR